MKLDDIPDHSRVLVDANIILYALGHKSATCRAFLVRCEARAIEGLISTVTLAEIGHRRMIEEARAAGLVGSNPARALSDQPSLIQQLRGYAEDVRDLLAGDLGVEAVRPDDFLVALELQHQHGLLTNDSLNLAIAKRLGIREIVSADKCFDNIEGMSVYKPDDLVG